MGKGYLSKGVLFILICLIIIGWTGGNSTAREKIGVVVSIPPQAEFVEKVGGDKVRVRVMVPPGASPHIYEPTAGQLREVSRAKIYFKIGSGIEFELTWMDKIISINKKMLLVNCSKGIELIEGDPHIWLSPRNVKLMVENIYQGLVQVDPANREYYTKNKENYLQELTRLDEEITRKLSEKKNRKFMVYHPAWAYLAKDYGLEQIPMEKEGKKPTIKGIASLIKQARANNIKIIFASPQFDIKSVRVIAEEIGGEVILISPLEKNYLENMRKITEILAKSLQ